MRRRARIRRWLRDALSHAGAAVAAMFEPSVQFEESRMRHARLKREG